MNLLFTICGRAGSKGLKNKNLKRMNGIPLPYYTLAAIEAYKVNHPEHSIYVALNTDSPELIRIIEIQKCFKDIEIVHRETELAGDRVAKVEVIQDTYNKCKEKWADIDIDLVIDLDLTSPMRRTLDIEKAVDLMIKNSQLDLVYSVVPSRRSPYFNMVEKKDDAMYRKVCSSNYTARQQAPQVYELNASIYVYRKIFLEQKIKKTILDYNCGIVEMEDYLVLDIDSEDDFVMMEYLFQYFCSRDDQLAKLVERARQYCD